MNDPLIRRLVIALLGLMPTVLFALAAQSFHPPGRMAAAAAGLPPGLAALPGSPDAAPLITNPLLPSALSADAMERARQLNAGDPFMAGTPKAALKFRFQGTPGDLANARECLALAAMAEAGNTDSGQRAVIQVILNRVRHPAFAKTVCGVVFEGSQRVTGCQFSFTCDGSLARRYGETAWLAARDRALDALKGYVFPPVGAATHYHTDWVYPSWSPQLEKIAQIETHLFYRWPGVWGTSASWQNYRGSEPAFAVLMGAPDPGADPAPEATAAALGEFDASAAIAPLPADTPKITGGQVAMRTTSGKANFVLVRPSGGALAALSMARQLCTAAGTCRVMGWSSLAQIPAAFPLPPAARKTLQFSYARDPGGAEITLYDCDTFEGVLAEQCIPAAR